MAEKSAPAEQDAEQPVCLSGAFIAGGSRQCILRAGHEGHHRMPTGAGIAYVDEEGEVVADESVRASPDSVMGRFRVALAGGDLERAHAEVERLCELLVEMAREHQAACRLAQEANDRLLGLLDRRSAPAPSTARATEALERLDSALADVVDMDEYYTMRPRVLGEINKAVATLRAALSAGSASPAPVGWHARWVELCKKAGLDSLENHGGWGTQTLSILATIESAIAASAAPKATTPDGWRGIESAPKDGTPVIVAREDRIYGWVRGHARWEAVGGIGGWISHGFTDPPGNLGLAHPTLWQPLPAAPVAAAQERETP